MKKALSLLLTFVFLMSFCCPAYASSTTTKTLMVSGSGEYIQCDDGSYITVVLSSKDNVSKASSTKQGNKVVTKYDSNDNVLWTYTLSATFSYVNGVSATCTNATYSYENFSSTWYFSNGSAVATENVAHGYGKFELKWIGLIVIETVNIDISITCDVYGNLS